LEGRGPRRRSEAGSNHGSKLIAVPFDAAAFDADNGGGTGGMGERATAAESAG